MQRRRRAWLSRERVSAGGGKPLAVACVPPPPPQRHLLNNNLHPVFGIIARAHTHTHSMGSSYLPSALSHCVYEIIPLALIKLHSFPLF